MDNLKLFGIILASLSPLVVISSQAQLDLFSPIEVMQEQHCLDHPELRNEPTCQKYYKQNPGASKNPNTTAPTPRRSTRNGSSRPVIAEYRCNGSSRLVGKTILCDGKAIPFPSACSSIQYKQGVYRCFQD